MLNFIWPVFLIISFVYGVCFGNIAETNTSECEDGSIILEITISDPYAFHAWALSLGKDCIVESPADIAEWVRNENEEAYTQISMNMVANVMGLRKCCYPYRIESNAIVTKEK